MTTPSVLVLFVGGWGAAHSERNPFYQKNAAFLSETIARFPSLTLAPYSGSVADYYFQASGGESTSLVRMLAAHDVKQYFFAGPDRFGLLTNQFARQDEIVKDPGVVQYIPFPTVQNLQQAPETIVPELVTLVEEKLKSTGDTAMYVALDSVWTMMNYAEKNPELIPHAIQVLGKQVSRLVQRALEQNWRVLVVSDSSGAESQFMDGETKEDAPLPCILIANDLDGMRAEKDDTANEDQFSLNPSGQVQDLAPTLLSLFHIPLPPEMKASPLFSKCLQQL